MNSSIYTFISKIGLLAFVFLPTLVLADVPSVFSYTGNLSNSEGPINGTVSITLTMYKDDNGDGICNGGSVALDPTGCTAQWTETHPSVAVSNGVFSVELGSITSFGDIGFSNPKLLGLDVNGDGVMNPLVRLTSAPTALRAEATKGSQVAVDCTTDGTGEKIQSAINGGATKIMISGYCTGDVVITRNGVSLVGTGSSSSGILGVDNGQPALHVIGATRVSVQGLAISNANSTTSGVIVVEKGSAVSFNDITVPVTSSDMCTAMLVTQNSTVNMEYVSLSSPACMAMDVSKSSSAHLGNKNDPDGSVSIEGKYQGSGSGKNHGLSVQQASSVEAWYSSFNVSSGLGNAIRVDRSSSFVAYHSSLDVTVAPTATSNDNRAFTVTGSSSIRLDNSTTATATIPTSITNYNLSVVVDASSIRLDGATLSASNGRTLTLARGGALLSFTNDLPSSITNTSGIALNVRDGIADIQKATISGGQRGIVASNNSTVIVRTADASVTGGVQCNMSSRADASGNWHAWTLVSYVTDSIAVVDDDFSYGCGGPNGRP